MDRPALTPEVEAPARPSGNFGKLAYSFLAVSLLSGAALVPHYDPVSPLLSLETIVGAVPLGSFLRGLHAWSSFAVLGATLVHVVQVAWRRTEGQLGLGAWWRAVALVPLLLLALLGGFVLRGDAEARAAGDVWRGLMASIPVVGQGLAAFVLGGVHESLGAVALHHAGTVSILVLLFTIEHARLVWPGTRPATLATLVSVGAAGLLSLPLGPPPPGRGILLGPWALLGLQGMLVDLPVALGWGVPLLLVALLGALRASTGRMRGAVLAALGTLVLAWIAFSVRILLLAGGR
jgi:Cytochrome b/b6/petB